MTEPEHPVPEPEAVKSFLEEIRDKAQTRLADIQARVDVLEGELTGLRSEQIDVARVLAAAEGREFKPSPEEVRSTVNALADATKQPPVEAVAPPDAADEQTALTPEPEPEPEPTPEPQPEVVAPTQELPSDSSAAVAAPAAINEKWIRAWDAGDEQGRWFTPKDVQEVDGVSASVASIRAILAKLVDKGTLEQRGEGFRLEFRVKPPQEQRANGGPVAVPGRRGRAYDRAAIRDWMRGAGEFTAKALGDQFGLSSGSITNITREFMDKGTIERVKLGVYRYTKPSSNGGGPTSRPRGEEHVGGDAAPKGRGHAVPGTGVPAGPAERPGRLKRQQAKARRVKKQPVKGHRK